MTKKKSNLYKIIKKQTVKIYKLSFVQTKQKKE